jgi:hypothetical protein
MARIQKQRVKGPLMDLHTGLGSVMESINSMEIGNDNMDNIDIMVGKLNTYQNEIKQFISELLWIDSELVSINAMIPRFPEMIDLLVTEFKKYYFKMPEIPDINVKNALITLQNSDFLDKILRVSKNMSKCNPSDGINVRENIKYMNRAKTSLLFDDFESLFSSDLITESVKTRILSAKSIGRRIYDCRKRPDIDIKEMFKMIMKFIGTMKKDVPGCERAMELMERSSKLFEENYIDYYKTMIKTGSPISMIENFTADVIKDNNNGSIKDLLQLKKLSRFLRKMIAKQGAVPENVRKMMDKLENVFDSIGTNEFDEDFQEI